MKFDLVVIGGGAAGFFGAIEAAARKPGLSVLILEKTGKLLSKVKVSGGGRCNVTHQCFNPFELARHYPRGEKTVKTLFKSFHASHIVEWFSERAVALHAETDGRMFPVTNNSQTIIDCFLQEADRLKIQIQLNHAVKRVVAQDHFILESQNGETFYADKILVAMGGHAQPEAYSWIASLGHTIKAPIPSLFTFNDSVKAFTDLMGVSVPDAVVKIAGTKYVQRGPVLITHWGLSGPAIIKLSAWAASELHARDYRFDVLLSWIGPVTEEVCRQYLMDQKTERVKQRVFSNPLYGLPQRLWQRICEHSTIEETKVWGELPQKSLNKLLENLIRCTFQIKGKTTFKEEFVTCGGVALDEIDTVRMESKKVKGLYFAGEVLDIDGETGGFNFQAAWTTAYLAALAITTEL